jgi:hypothetical protein
VHLAGKPEGGRMPKITTTNIARPIPPDAIIIFAKDMKPGEEYQTVQSTDPKKQYLARLVEVRPENVLLEAYLPEKKSWSQVEVPHTYRLTPYPKETLDISKRKHRDSGKVTSSRSMHNKLETLKKKPVRDLKFGQQAPQRTGDRSGLPIYAVWGKAFRTFGKCHDAPERIVKYMEAEFPGRKTQWKKWVNAVRARFNSGKLPQAQPFENPIPVYRSAYLGNELPAEQLKPKKTKKGGKNGIRKPKTGLPERETTPTPENPNQDLPVQA